MRRKKPAQKKEWESLKKGYVMQNADARPGETSLHVYIGGGYTGALAFASFEGENFVYKCGGYKENGSVDFLTRLGADGSRLGPAWLQGECAQASDFCLSEDGSRLAIISYGKAHIVDLKSANLTLSFELEHVVKRCEAKFENSNGSKNLAVRTDYGCFSLYRV